MDDMNPVGSDQSAPPVARRGRRWLGQALRWGIGLGAALVVFNVLLARRDELAGSLTALENVRYQWVFFAVVAELASIGAFAVLTRQLLRAGGVDIGLAVLGGIALVGLVVSEDQAASLDLVRVIVAVALAILLLVVAARRGLVSLPGRRAAVLIVAAYQRLVHRPRGDAAAVVDSVFDRL